MATFKLSATASALDEVCSKQKILDLVYPVGSIYLSVNSTNPGTIIGGTWVEIQNRFLLGRSSTYAAGSTGGEATHTLTVSETPKHAHIVYVWDNAGTTGNAYYYKDDGSAQTHSGARLYNGSASTWVASGSTAAAASSGRGDTSGGTNVKGGGGAHNNMPPYLAVYMWKRTA